MKNCQKYFNKSTSNRLLKSTKFKTGWIINLLFIDGKNYKYQDVWLAETSGMQILCAGILHERRGMCVFTWSWFNPTVHWLCTGKSYELYSSRKIALNMSRTDTKIFYKSRNVRSSRLLYLCEHTYYNFLLYTLWFAFDTYSIIKLAKKDFSNFFLKQNKEIYFTMSILYLAVWKKYVVGQTFPTMILN